MSNKSCHNRTYQDLRLRKGNVYRHISGEIERWLMDEAVKLGRCDVGLIIAAIVKDAYFEEMDALENAHESEIPL